MVWRWLARIDRNAVQPIFSDSTDFDLGEFFGLNLGFWLFLSSTTNLEPRKPTFSKNRWDDCSSLIEAKHSNLLKFDLNLHLDNSAKLRLHNPKFGLHRPCWRTKKVYDFLLKPVYTSFCFAAGSRNDPLPKMLVLEQLGHAPDQTVNIFTERKHVSQLKAKWDALVIDFWTSLTK